MTACQHSEKELALCFNEALFFFSPFLFPLNKVIMTPKTLQGKCVETLNYFLFPKASSDCM